MMTVRQGQANSHHSRSSWLFVILFHVRLFHCRLNTVMTVRQGQANSHKGKGWETFTDAAISLLAQVSKQGWPAPYNYGIYMVLLAGKSPELRSIRCTYTVLANPLGKQRLRCCSNMYGITQMCMGCIIELSLGQMCGGILGELTLGQRCIVYGMHALNSLLEENARLV